MTHPRITPGITFALTLEKGEQATLKKYALQCIERKKIKGFREYKDSTPLEYRTDYIRDRDRIIWSRSFKRLQHKTQIFPHYTADHYRRRLTHTLEVSQIATTIARALGLNVSATEAIALGHDLGHAPFGHGGETALNDCLIKLSTDPTYHFKESKEIPIFSFNHAVHGVETVERIEKEYKSSYIGLNLTFDVREGILKHNPDVADEIKKHTIPFSKYSIFEANFGSLEAQCVYIADKIAFFFADFEDALRSKILDCENLRERKFTSFQKLLAESIKKNRKGKARTKNLTEEIYNSDDFLELRRDGIAGIILDIITNSEEKIKSNNIETVKDGKRNRFIGLSDKLEEARYGAYKEYIEEKVFNHVVYQVTEHKAKKIVGDLFGEYHKNFNLIPGEFQEQMDDTYRNLIKDEPSRKIMLVKNYIAGMTDSFAIARHRDLFMSSENITIS